MRDSRQILRFTAAICWCTAIFLSMPLAFARLGGSPVPFFGTVQLVTLPVMTLFSLAVLCAFPERLKNIPAVPGIKILFAGAAGFLLITLFHFASGNITLDSLLAACFWISVPLGAAALSEELKKVFPYFAAAGTLLLIFSGIQSEKFTGLLGNWNWTCGAITALLPGIFILFCGKRWKIFTLAGAIIFFAAMAIYCGEIFPRSALLAAIGAAALIFIRNNLPGKKFRKFLLTAAAAGSTIFFIFLYITESFDTRVIIWDSALKLFLAEPYSGCGNGMFAEFIRYHLPETYYFSAFPAPHIDHAHNDLLNLLAECGIAGAFFYFAAIITILRRREKTPVMIFMQWAFLVMIICGCFDQHNLTLTGGSILAISAGILLAPRTGKQLQIMEKYHPLAAIAASLFLIAAIFQAKSTFLAASLLRSADLKIFENDIAGALDDYQASIEIKPSANAFYQQAQLFLALNQPEKTLHAIGEMEKSCLLKNYRHTHRLKAIAACQLNDLPTAVAEMNEENILAPFSIISADFQRYLLLKTNAGSEIIQANEEHFIRLCQLRKITPAMLRDPGFIEIDDGKFPEDVILK